MSEFNVALLTQPASHGEPIQEPKTGKYERKKVTVDKGFQVEGRPSWRNMGETPWPIVGIALLNEAGELKGFDNTMKDAEVKEGDTFVLTEIALGI